MLTRNTMGEVIEVEIARDNAHTICEHAKKQVYRSPREMTWAIDRFCREAYLEDRHLEFSKGDEVRRIKLSDYLNERLLLEPCFFEDHRLCTYATVDELVVEKKR